VYFRVLPEFQRSEMEAEGFHLPAEILNLAE